MVVRWKQAGKPLDETVRHPFTPWAKTIGGILQVNGFADFLANYHHRKTADDPLRHGLATLGATKPDEWLRPEEWATVVDMEGLVKALIPTGDKDSKAGRVRGIGVVLSPIKMRPLTPKPKLIRSGSSWRNNDDVGVGNLRLATVSHS